MTPGTDRAVTTVPPQIHQPLPASTASHIALRHEVNAKAAANAYPIGVIGAAAELTKLGT